jgi:hypothetical protein
MSPTDSPPTCPHCGAPMRLARTVPRAFGHPELRSFECRPCREAVTVEVLPLVQGAQSATPNFPKTQTVAR